MSTMSRSTKNAYLIEKNRSANLRPRKFQGIILLLIRIWLGYTMIMGGKSVLTLFTADKQFFEDWFGNQLGFPAPLFMAFLAKGTEFVGGILVWLGLFTRISA